MRILPILALTFAALLFFATTSARADDHSKLKSVKVTFHTPGDKPHDDKDWDTRVAVSITNGDTEIASADDIAHNEPFKDPSDHGPYDLAVKTAVSKADFLAGKTKVTIAPNGHDTWYVIVEVTAEFEDGTTVVVKSDRLKLSQDDKEKSKEFPNKH